MKRLRRSHGAMSTGGSVLAGLVGGRPRDYLAAVAAVTAAVAVSALLERLVPVSIASFSLIFLTGVLIVAARTALAPAMGTAVLGFLAYNYFFTEPRYTFEITRPDELVAVALFLVTGLIGGDLANRLQRQVAALRATNEQSRKLLELNRRLAAAPDAPAIYRVAADTLYELLGVAVCVIAPGTGGETPASTVAVPADTAPPANPEAAPGAAAKRRDNGRAPNDWHFTSLEIEGTSYGTLGLRLADLSRPPSGEELQLIEALASQVTQALARSRLAAHLEEARLAEETERLRSILLSSISHDLRTPLSSMIGAASSLRDLEAQLSAADRRELLDTLLSEGHRLDRYIENLLDMTRLGHGPLALKRDWVAPADIVGAAIRRLRNQFPDTEVVRAVPDDLPLLYVHAALIEQALFNVLENAARFSPAGAAVRIDIEARTEALVIDVIDEGPGIPESDRERVFDMFVTADDAQRYGSGLGLAICRGMVAAHGGTVDAHPGPGDRGTRVRVSLPLTPGSAGDAVEAEG